VVFIPWSTGTMFEFERRLYAENLPVSEWNRNWWEIVARYQGIAPPAPRDERWCDAATKTHINDDPASYYDYALSSVLLFQLHQHIATKILKEDPRDTNYYGRKDVGDFLKSLLEPGATIDGQALLKEKTGSELSAAAMVSYFGPLMEWLKVQNAGRTHTLPEL
jgi:peptidyl-dipeptidase A